MKAYKVESHSFSFPQDSNVLAYFKTRELAKYYMTKASEGQGVHIYEDRKEFFEDNKDSIRILPQKMLNSKVLDAVFFKNTFQYVISYYVTEITIHS